MKVKRFIFLLIGISCIFALAQCNKVESSDEDCEDCLCRFDFTHEEPASIVGKWKLEKIRVISRLGIFCTDYSPYNVVYEFKENGILIVTGDIEDYNWTGDYSFVKDEWGMGQDGYPWGLNINGSTNWYILSSKKLIIDNSPLDGPTSYFVKID
jgi:hypothetical protein